MATRPTHRWWVGAFVALIGLAVGVLTGVAAPVAVGILGVVYAGYARSGTAPSPTLEVERTLDDPEPLPGDEVRVTLTVENRGGPVTDLRVVDGVPEALEVIDGSSRLGTALLSGESASLEYTLRAERGQHGFDPVTVISRDPSGSMERDTEVECASILTCLPPLRDVPLQAQTTQYTGRIVTNTGGSGSEFYATREYRPGDALSRVDWNRRARSGDLATVQFREERAAAVMLVIDARPTAYWGPAPEERNALAASVAAAGRAFAHLLAGGDRVGITVIEADDGTATIGESCWLSPGAGTAHANRARHLLATHPAISSIPPSDGPPELAIHPDHDQLEVGPLLSRLSPDTQLVLFSPLVDDGIVEAARQLVAHGHATTVISPDVNTDETLGTRLAGLQRDNRMHRLREAGIRVVDWDVSEPLTAALAHTQVEAGQ